MVLSAFTKLQYQLIPEIKRMIQNAQFMIVLGLTFVTTATHQLSFLLME